MPQIAWLGGRRQRVPEDRRGHRGGRGRGVRRFAAAAAGERLAPLLAAEPPALVIVELNQSRTLSWSLAYYGGGYLLALAVAHLLIRRYAPYADPLLLPIVALLNGIGLVMIYRLDLAREISAINRGEEVPTPQASLRAAAMALPTSVLGMP